MKTGSSQAEETHLQAGTNQEEDTQGEKTPHKPIGNFEDGQGHLSNRAYAQRSDDPIFKRIL